MKNLLNRYAFEPHTEQKTNSIKKKKSLARRCYTLQRAGSARDHDPCGRRIHTLWEKLQNLSLGLPFS